MLSQVNISNFAIIKNLELDLNKGMTVITGETGAGKSIVIDALDIALGDRADPNLIRNGANRFEINLTFDVSTIASAKAWLQTHDLDNGSDCIIRRIQAREGRSRSFINGSPVTLQQLRELALHLVHVHSQHQHHALMRTDEQRRILDRFLTDLKLIDKIKQAYQDWQAKKLSLADLKQQSINDAERTLLEYQVNELTELSLAEGEWEQLSTKQTKLAHSEALLDDLQFCMETLGDDNAVLSQLAEMQQRLEKMRTILPESNNVCDLITNAAIEINEANNELRDLISHTESDPELLASCEQRLGHMHQIARKHHVDPSELVTLTLTLSDRLQTLSGYDDKLALAEQDCTESFKNYLRLAKKLSVARAKAAKTLTQKITKSMQLLGMPEGQFHIAINSDEKNAGTHGIDSIIFEVNTNPGQKLMNMAKVASGGELSRISLAIQVMTAARNDTPTLVFDEVDVGISGATAEIVGKLLRELGETAQILCITHLPQVAAQGQHHIRIGKKTENKQTVSELLLLDKQARIEEIARMVGGVTITPQTLAHAEELLS